MSAGAGSTVTCPQARVESVSERAARPRIAGRSRSAPPLAPRHLARYSLDVTSGSPLRNDLERLVPDLVSNDPAERDILGIHLARYAFAAQYVAGRTVLDAACGVGYGSAMLQESGAASVLGVDLSTDAIAYARERYAGPRLAFEAADATCFTPAAPPEVIVSLETIEHVRDARGFVARLTGLLAPGGVFIGSVPTTLSSDVNPYHLHDFSASQFRALFRDVGLVIVEELEQEQRTSPLALRRLARTSRRNYQLRRGLLRYYVGNPGMLARRLHATVRDGFVNRYVVLAGRKA
jgi:2-polyprenyl-3-methyl-5-hydroxy-6-metoxy-1,4-benzoquinol methylase